MSSSDSPSVANPRRAICVRASSRSTPRISRLLSTMSVPMWPGITTATLTCGALTRKSSMSASVNPFTANFAAL